MAVDDEFPRLVFEFPFDEAAAYDAEARGYLSHVLVELKDGAHCPVVFYDPVRLLQDLEVESANGRAYISEPGLIVIPKVTIFHMKTAITSLFMQGYFEAFKREWPRRSE